MAVAAIPSLLAAGGELAAQLGVGYGISKGVDAAVNKGVPYVLQKSRKLASKYKKTQKIAKYIQKAEKGYDSKYGRIGRNVATAAGSIAGIAASGKIVNGIKGGLGNIVNRLPRPPQKSLEELVAPLNKPGRPFGGPVKKATSSTKFEKASKKLGNFTTKAKMKTKKLEGVVKRDPKLIQDYYKDKEKYYFNKIKEKGPHSEKLYTYGAKASSNKIKANRFNKFKL